jgi:AhpD family alkylhydroperoxidase
MEPRFAFSKIAPEVLSILLQMEKYLWACDLDERLLELVRIRVSQINGCAYCLEMHTKVARAAGETEQRLHMLPTWRDAKDLFSVKERAALAYAECMTMADPMHEYHLFRVSDEVFADMKKHFTEREIVDLNWVVIAINDWNRLAISCHGFDQGTVRAIYRAKKDVRAQKGSSPKVK